MHARLNATTEVMLVAVGDSRAERLIPLAPQTLASRGDRYRVRVALPRGIRAVGIAVRRGNGMSTSGLIRVR